MRERIFSPPPLKQTDWTQLILKFLLIFSLGFADKYSEVGKEWADCIIYGVKFAAAFYVGFGSYGKVRSDRLKQPR